MSAGIIYYTWPYSTPPPPPEFLHPPLPPPNALCALKILLSSEPLTGESLPCYFYLCVSLFMAAFVVFWVLEDFGGSLFSSPTSLASLDDGEGNMEKMEGEDGDDCEGEIDDDEKEKNIDMENEKASYPKIFRILHNFAGNLLPWSLKDDHREDLEVSGLLRDPADLHQGILE